MFPLAVLLATASTPQAVVKSVDIPDLHANNAYYTGNRAPLSAVAFRKLPIGAIIPKGWVRKQLELEAAGFTGHLDQVSRFLKKDGNAWFSKTGEGDRGWEEVPYWLKGFGDLGYVLGDKRIIGEARQWIESSLANQQEDGYFGPRSNLTASNGKADVWPNMVMLYALRSYYEYSKDDRVLTLLKYYFKWQLSIPDEDFLLSYWEKHRGGDNIDSVFWLYNRTGDEWLLDLAKKLHRRSADWTGPIPDLHGVNFAQAFREPAVFSQFSLDPRQFTATERSYSDMRWTYGQVPGGLYGADENARHGFVDARQAAETCTMVEMMQSCEMLLAQTGVAAWADRCEDVAFNSLPASMTADLKALRYLTAPNMVLSDEKTHAPGVENGGPMLLFNPFDHRCCQHNVSHGWPYFAEHLWMATGGNGLSPTFYVSSVVKAKVGGGSTATITETTDYPFDETVSFGFALAKPQKFPLTLRLPSWCSKPTLLLNGKPLAIPGPRRAYVIVTRTWKQGDKLLLTLPMAITLKSYEAQKGAVSVQRGPLSYSLRIGEKVERQGGTDTWPVLALLPTTDWNYGLVPDIAQFKVARKPLGAGAQPFTPEAVPITITVPVRQIPEWQIDRNGLVSILQKSPAHTDKPVQRVVLVPMGAARLRISVFPTVTPNGVGETWKLPVFPKPSWPATASHVRRGESLSALSDGIVPELSGDLLVPRFTWWDHKGTSEWVQVDLGREKSISEFEVYWFDDRATGGQCRAPASWKLQFLANGAWQDVEANNEYGIALDTFNKVTFELVTGSQFRVAALLQSGFSAGILEMRLK